MTEKVITREFKELDSIITILIGNEDDLSELLAQIQKLEDSKHILHKMDELDETKSMVNKLKDGSFKVDAQMCKTAFLIRTDL